MSRTSYLRVRKSYGCVRGMQTSTEAHLATAKRNQGLAHALLSSADIQPRPLEWSVVVAFYAAMHYINAYLWEKMQYAPHNHGERMSAVRTWTELKAVSVSYQRLQDLGYYARYRPNFHIPPSDATDLIQNDLRAVQNAVMQALAPAT